VEDELLGPLSYARSIAGIDKTQAVSLEAIGFAVDAVDVVYRRLTTYLRNRLPPPTIVFADAWAMIDWMHRLHGLVESCRGLTPRDEAVQEILDSSSLVETLRHIYQHPERELRLTAETRRSVWGHVAWQRMFDGGHEVVQLTPFGRWEGEFRLPAGAEEPPRAPVDRVSLFSPDGEAEIGLTGQWEAAVRFGLRLEGALQASERPAEGEIMKLRAWLPASPNAVYPGIAERVR
jgi:hypothetical protein